MSASMTNDTSIDDEVAKSVIETLTVRFVMEEAAVRGCLDGSMPDVAIASRVALVVIARAVTRLGLPDLIDPKGLRPEQVTSVRNVAALVTRALTDRTA